MAHLRTPAFTNLALWTREPAQALDLGCGAGRDSLALLAAGWEVTALDRDPQALALLREQAAMHAPGKLSTLCRTFEDATALPAADLINASFALPFCQPDAFGNLWLQITRSLREYGLFTGHFFGPRDDWARNDFSIHSRDQLQQQFEGWTLLELNEFEYDGKTALGRTKHWHLFEVIARKD